MSQLQLLVSFCLWKCLILPVQSDLIYSRIVSEEKLFKHLFVDRAMEMSTFPYCIAENSNNVNGGSIRFEESKMSIDDYKMALLHQGKAALNVEIQFGIINLVSVSEQDQTLLLELHTETQWTDCRLAWSPGDFNQVKNFSIHPNRYRTLGLFAPMVYLREEMILNAAEPSEVHVHVTSSGSITVYREQSSVISCDLDMSMYPFDQHECNITFETLYSSSDVNLTYTLADSIVLESQKLLSKGRYTRNQLWELVALPPIKTTRPACKNTPNDSPDSLHCSIDRQIFRVVMSRHPTYQVINLFVPAFLCMIVSISIYIIPTGASDKTFLMLCILLSMFWFSFSVYNKMPDTGSTLCLTSLYYFICISLTAINCIECAVSTTISSSKVPVPRLLRRFVAFFSPFLLRDMVNMHKCRLTAELEDHNNELDDNETHNEENGNRRMMHCVHEPHANDHQHAQITWNHVSACIDRLYCAVLFVTAISATVAFIANGYMEAERYYAYRLSGEDLKYATLQLADQGDEDNLN